jgi:hypothetical protein
MTDPYPHQKAYLISNTPMKEISVKNTFSRGFCGFRHRSGGDFARDRIAFKTRPQFPKKGALS